jgi:hypothetical protein
MQNHNKMDTEKTMEQMLDALAVEGRIRRLAQGDCTDLPFWCYRRRHRANLCRRVGAVCILATISFSSATIMAKQLPDSKMRVPVPFQQETVNNLSDQIIALL